MKMTGARFGPLMDDLEAAASEIVALAKRHPGFWDRALPEKWTMAQHIDHVAVGVTSTAMAFEESEQRLRSGTLPRRPWRGPLQSLFVAIAVGAGRLPRGGRTPRSMRPAPHPDRDEVLSRLTRDLARHRGLGERSSANERDRLWIANPYRASWQYTFPEILRVHSVHIRHHARQIEELVAAGATHPR